MPSDRRSRNSGPAGAYNRAAAITRFLKKHEGVITTNAYGRGLEGIRVSQNIGESDVTLRVWLDDADAATTWASEIRAKLEAAGYTVWQRASILTITRDEWVQKDKIQRALSRCLLSGAQAIASDTALANAEVYVIELLRDAGMLEEGSLRLTELGEQARAHVNAEQKKDQQRRARARRTRGW